MNAFPIPFPALETWAQVAIERVTHSLPEGLLIALFAWGVLRVLPRQNSRTRFAVWFVALMAVAGIAFFGGSPVSDEFSRSFGSARVSEILLPAHWASYLFFGWLLIASFAMARLALGLWHLRALRLSCTPVDRAAFHPAIAATMDELNLARSFGSRRVTLATSERVRVPSALGLWKPVIALPTWAFAELPADELIIILRHEFAHLRRWDDWTNLVQKVVRAVFFFHPAVWWIESRLSVEREMACDDIVVAETDNPMGYANCLVSLLERSLAQRGWTMAQAIVHRAREASERVAQILDKNRPAARGISKPVLGLVGTFAALCAVMLPATPQFVAFDRGTAPVVRQYSAGLVRSASLRNVAYGGSMLPVEIPASLRMSEPNASGVNVVMKAVVYPVVKPDAEKNGRPVSGRPRSVLASAVRSRNLQRDDLADTTSASAAELLSPPNMPSEVNSVADQNVQPATLRPSMQRVLFVRDAQFVTTEVPVAEFTIVALPRGPVLVWSVQMMRVTLVAPVWREMRMPAAKKI